MRGFVSAETKTICWMVIFFFASAAASSAYLTISETFPLEIRALAIAIFYAVGTGIGGVAGPLCWCPHRYRFARERILRLRARIGTDDSSGGDCASMGGRCRTQAARDGGAPARIPGLGAALELVLVQGEGRFLRLDPGEHALLEFGAGERLLDQPFARIFRPEHVSVVGREERERDAAFAQRSAAG